MLMLKRPNYFSKFLPSWTACLVLPGPALRALKIIYTGLAVISLHNGAASNISLTTHHTSTPPGTHGGGTTWNIFRPNNFPGDRKTENIIFFKVRNNEEGIPSF